MFVILCFSFDLFLIDSNKNHEAIVNMENLFEIGFCGNEKISSYRELCKVYPMNKLLHLKRVRSQQGM